APVAMVRRGGFWARYERARIACAALLASLVLLGGIVPALYSYGQPHDHFVLGAPTAEWEAHEHVNPLAVLIGPIAPQSSTAAPAQSLTTARPSLGHQHGYGQVVSVSSGTAPLVLTELGFAIRTVIADQIVRADVGAAVTRAGKPLVS